MGATSHATDTVSDNDERAQDAEYHLQVFATIETGSRKIRLQRSLVRDSGVFLLSIILR